MSPYAFCIHQTKLTLKTLSKFAADDILKLILLFFRESKIWYFMWI